MLPIRKITWNEISLFILGFQGHFIEFNQSNLDREVWLYVTGYGRQRRKKMEADLTNTDKKITNFITFWY